MFVYHPKGQKLEDFELNMTKEQVVYHPAFF